MWNEIIELVNQDPIKDEDNIVRNKELSNDSEEKPE